MEATGGFEPPNRGFADLRLSPLGYVASYMPGSSGGRAGRLTAGAALVPRAGLEPTRACAHGPLKTACLPNSTTSADWHKPIIPHFLSIATFSSNEF